MQDCVDTDFNTGSSHFTNASTPKLSILIYVQADYPFMLKDDLKPL